MPQTRDIALEELAEAGDALSITATRVDSAHSIGDALASLPPIREMPVDLAINDLVRVEGAVQLQAQAEQLAAHLKQRQEEIDSREGQLRTRLAEFEQEVREARLWLAQRDAELNDREKQLNERERELPATAKSTSTSRPAADRPPVRASAEASEKHRPDLAPHASWVAESQWEDRKKALSRQSEELDRRRAALEKFRDEIATTHHEALEMRLAGEELQAQLRASLGVAAADESLKAIRERLARSYENEINRLTCRQHELEWLKCDLAAEAGKLERRYAELQDWVAQHRPQVARDKSEVSRY
jgi:hypothetical protein